MENLQADIIFYSSPAGNVKVEVIFNDETFWLNQKRLAELFGVDVRTVNEYLQNIFSSGELDREATVRKIRTVQGLRAGRRAFEAREAIRKGLF